MRRTKGATWQTVVVRTDGTGYVAIFIGELGGNTEIHETRLATARVRARAAATLREPGVGDVDRGGGSLRARAQAARLAPVLHVQPLAGAQLDGD
jgi:hypothetical protein